MPFKLGAHPAFALTDHFENYQLEFADDNQLNCFHLEDGLLSGETNTIPLYNNRLDLNYKLFEKDALVIKQLNSKLVTILKSGLPYLRLHLNDFPNLGIWTKPGAGFICVEPWLGYTDPIDATEIMEQKESIQILNPHEKLTCGFAIEIL
jgi:galactose mutarotase-like enzyme